MSWGMGGPWNPGMASMPSQNMGISGYTPDQWAAMQQQNWQWSQWQQYSHSQWQQQQPQYGGDKFGQQMSNMQMVPPLPPNPVPPPGPPPVVPPPPHENNKPLYAQPEAQANNQSAQMNTSNTSWRGNEQKQPQISNEPVNQNNFAASSQPVVSGDLQKLNEEERQFDIQFKKWEEEVEEWRQKNVSHPDKETYKKYEDTFLTYRAELLERRKQMQIRKSSLIINKAPIVQDNTPNNRNHIPNAPVAYHQPPTNVISNRPNTNISQIPYNQNHYEYNPVNRGPMSQHNNSRMGNNISMPTKQNNTSMSDTNTSTFVQINRSSQGIPGLDLVPAANKPAKIPDLMNMTVRRTNNLAPASQKFSEISKGINNILGDEKIMNILSIFRNNFTNQQNDSESNIPQSTFGQVNNNLNDSNQNMNQNFQRNNQWNTNQNEMSNNNVFQNDNEYQDEPFQDDQYQEDPYQGDEYKNDPYQGEYQDDPYRDDKYQTNYYDNDQYPKEPFQNENFNNGPHGPRYPPQPLMQRQNENIPRPNRNVRGPYQQGQPDGVPPYSERRDLQSPIVIPNPGIRENPDQAFGNVENLPPKAPPVKPFVEEPMFVASIIVDYAHKPARLKDREFLEPAHIFEYNHLSKSDNYKSLDFDTVSRNEFLRKERNVDEVVPPRHESNRDQKRPDRKLFDRCRDSRDRHRREDSRDERRRPYSDRRYDDDRRKLDDDRRVLDEERRRFDSDKRKYNDRDDRNFTRREEPRDRYRARKDSRSGSRELEHGSKPKIMKTGDNAEKPVQGVPLNLIMIDDILKSPGREMRPDKIVIILRGPPGSGKSYMAKLIRDKETEHGTSVRVMSIDDYFQQETEVSEKDPTTGKMVKKTVIKYEYDADSEEDYNTSLRRSFKRTVADGFFPFLIVDAINEQLKHYAEMWNCARQCGFQVYICTMELDPQICYKRNIHNRTLEEIKSIAARFSKTPPHHIVLDATTLLQSAAIQEVDMEDVDSDNDVAMEDVYEELFCSINKFQDTPSQGSSAFTSKWEKMDDMTQLARLDGTSKPLRHSKLSMEDYLQLDDWQPTHRAQPGKKTVRWADIEERREQEKMRAIGFVVGHTDWNRMTDPTMGSSALTQTKYIERVRRTQ